MKRPGLSHIEDMILDALDTSDHDAVGRDKIIKGMGLDNTNSDIIKLYTDAVDSLINKDILCKTQGRGGGIRYSDSIQSDEKSVYDNFQEYITSIFLKKHINTYDKHFILKDTYSNKKQIEKEGKWINPDFLLIWHEKYRYSLPNQSIKTISFEIKVDTSQYVTGVFEATSHSRYSNKSFLVIRDNDCVFLDDNALSSYSNIKNRVLAECKRLNVGLIAFYHQNVLESYKMIYNPESSFPDLLDHDKFLNEHLEARQLGQIQHWLG